MLLRWSWAEDERKMLFELSGLGSPDFSYKGSRMFTLH